MYIPNKMSLTPSLNAAGLHKLQQHGEPKPDQPGSVQGVAGGQGLFGKRADCAQQCHCEDCAHNAAGVPGASCSIQRPQQRVC